MGLFVGANVGAFDGVSVGLFVGANVGAFDGASVGDSVGEAVVGAFVGADDVGTAVVGLSVGAFVGAKVIISSLPIIDVAMPARFFTRQVYSPASATTGRRIVSLLVPSPLRLASYG